MSRLSDERPEPSTTDTPTRATPASCRTEVTAAEPASHVPASPRRRPSSLSAISAVSSSLSVSISATISRPVADPKVAMSVMPSGAAPVRGAPTTSTPRRRRRSVTTAAALPAGSTAAAPSGGRLTPSVPARPSFTVSAPIGPDSVAWKRVGQDGWKRSPSKRDPSPTMLPSTRVMPAATMASARPAGSTATVGAWRIRWA